MFSGKTDKVSMIISGNHMNYGFMQKLQAQKKQGKNLGSMGALLDNGATNKLGKGLAVSRPEPFSPEVAAKKAEAQPGKLPKDAPKTIGQTVANEIVRRMEEKKDAAGQPKSVDGLRHSLGSTLDWIEQRFGKETATAAAGMVLGGTSGSVSEKSLGDGLLNTLRFIDRNHGFSAGDEAISRFNSGVNTELNKYFDNGLTETFHVVSPPPKQAGKSESTRLFMRTANLADMVAKDEKTPDQKLLESLKKELDKSAKIHDLATQLEERFGLSSNVSVPEATTAYTAEGQSQEPHFASVMV